jgi:hypothetical protein
VRPSRRPVLKNWVFAVSASFPHDLPKSDLSAGINAALLISDLSAHWPAELFSVQPDASSIEAQQFQHQFIQNVRALGWCEDYVTPPSTRRPRYD